jgi:hypothetical protein
MIEIAIGYVGAYLARKALGVVDRAGADADRAVDDALGKLYDWVKGKLTGAPNGELSLDMLAEQPEGDNQQRLVTNQLREVIGDDEAANQQLQALVAELERVRPAGLTVTGLARADDVLGRNVGVDAEQGVPEGTGIISGTAEATNVREGGENVGVVLGPGTTRREVRHPPNSS